MTNFAVLKSMVVRPLRTGAVNARMMFGPFFMPESYIHNRINGCLPNS